MSRLKELVNALGTVIVNYYQTQTKDRAIERPSQYSRDFYEDLISKATKGYPIRKGFLDYLLYAMDTLRPLTDKMTPLSMEEEKNTSNLLINLINNIQLLLDSSKDEEIDITYSGKTVKMEGFTLGFTRGYSYCNIGQIINKELIVPFHLEKTDLLIEFTIKPLINEHQQPLLEVQEIISNTQQELLLQKTKAEALQEEIRILKAENETVKTTLCSLEEKNLALKKKVTEQAEHIGCLMEQNSAATRGTNSAGTMGNMAHYLSFFPGAVRAAEASTKLYPGFPSNAD